MKTNKTFKSLLILLILSISAPVISDPPAQSGPIVIRYEGAPFFSGGILPLWIPDMKSGMSITLGIDNIDFCLGGFNLDTVSIKEIDIPEDANRINQQLSGSVQAAVWPFTVFECDLFLTVPPLATGYADIQATDNDLLVFLNPDNVNHNAFGISAHGKLQDMWGATKQMSFTYRVNWDGNDDSTFKEVIKVKLN